jgi:hypothetical protein
VSELTIINIVLMQKVKLQSARLLHVSYSVAFLAGLSPVVFVFLMWMVPFRLFALDIVFTFFLCPDLVDSKFFDPNYRLQYRQQICGWFISVGIGRG